MGWKDKKISAKRFFVRLPQFFWQALRDIQAEQANALHNEHSLPFRPKGWISGGQDFSLRHVKTICHLAWRCELNVLLFIGAYGVEKAATWVAPIKT